MLVGRPASAVLPAALLPALLPAVGGTAAVVHAGLPLGAGQTAYGVVAQAMPAEVGAGPWLLLVFIAGAAPSPGPLQILDMQCEMISHWLPDGTIVYCNEAFARQCGRNKEAVIGARLDDLTPPDEMAQIRANVARLSPASPTAAYDHRVAAPDGSPCWQEWIDRALYDGEGRLLGYLSVGRDISARKLAEQRQAWSEARLRLALDAGRLGVWEAELPQDRVLLDAVCAARLGFAAAPQVVTLAELRDLLHPDDRDRIWGLYVDGAHGVGTRFQTEYRVRHRDGHWLWFNEQAIVVECGEHGRPVRLLGISADITLRKHTELRLTHLAQHDDLTGLPNRRAFTGALAQSLARNQEPHQVLAVFLLDLDGFKSVNDCFGHETGDRVLAEVGRRLRHAVRGQDLVARLGGDEFAIVAQSIRRSTARQLARRVRTAVRGTPGALGIAAWLDVSIGIALQLAPGGQAQTLLAEADRALYAAKRERTGWRFASDLPAVDPEAV